MKILTLAVASLALASVVGCNSNDRSPTTNPSGTTTTPPATSSKATDSSTTTTTTTTSGSSTVSEADRALAQRVEQTLQQDAKTASAAQRVQVHANNGQVTLTGSVNSQEEKTEVGNKVQQITGVSHVDNQLTVTSASR
jgi:osmotically-inducible protein OsmY